MDIGGMMYQNNIFRCVVEDNLDPLMIGRVRLRVQGIHSAKLNEVSTENLPWSEVLSPIDSGNGLGSSTNILIGTWGFCTPLNDSFSEFLMLGVSKGIIPEPVTVDFDGDDIGFRDTREEALFPIENTRPGNPLENGSVNNENPVQDRVQVDSFTETADTSSSAVYPNNKVYQDHNGNLVEIDGTPENSRIRIQHSTGARVEISVDGDITIQASANGNVWQETPGLFSIGADGNMIIEADVKIVGSLEVSTEITAGSNISSGGDVTDSIGNLDVLRTAHNDHVAVFDAHTHPITGGSSAPGPTAVTPTPGIPDPTGRWGDFVWVGTEK